MALARHASGGSIFSKMKGGSNAQVAFDQAVIGAQR
ncbi:hypothetical protein SAMN05421751_10256 [Jhaorihella thermophila]|uniref:Uncharacterized protein n=1 Tax=Jhaorihella thermophila TaxID=488547 RepID=A0A1H5T3G9_9RHOB|nr:hypothetical protein SAMN05421751_10256 [Jhaorihella thermophila]